MLYTIITPLSPRAVSESDTKGVYEIDSLHPGYGHTIGNSLRRVLLSSLPGAAITKVKITGVPHEFSTIPDIKEDVISILLNLKQVRFELHSDEPQDIKLSVKGVKKVTASDFEVPSQVEIKSKDAPIAALTSKDAHLEIEATVERGLGYIPREVLEKEKVAVGVLTLDAIFTPIRKANYEVENMRVGDKTDYNRLRIFIETDGTITPREALKKSISILKEQLRPLEAFEDEKVVETWDEKEPEVAESNNSEDPLKIRIEDLGLSSRSVNVLTAAGIRTVGGLVKKTKDELLKLQGVGDKAITEIEKALGQLELSLKEE